MTARELDALVAERVMGWTSIKWRSDGRMHGQTWASQPVKGAGITNEVLGKPPGAPDEYVQSRLVPDYTTEAGPDYAVLDHIRFHWTRPPYLVTRFWMELDHVWQGREAGGYPMAPFMWYQPGDYSMAALKVLGAI